MARIRLISILALAAVAAAVVLAAELTPDRARLVLKTGDHVDARGPITRRDGMILFRTADGRLVSLPEDAVKTVVAAPAEPDRASSGVAQLRLDPSASGVYTNADLPPPPLGENPQLIVKSDPTKPVEEWAVINAVSAADAEAEREAWWRASVKQLRGEIEELEAEETLHYRLLTCVQQGIDIRSGECRPRPNRLTPVNRLVFLSPTEKSLAKKLRDVRLALEERRAELDELLEEARRDGVPPGWLEPPR